MNAACTISLTDWLTASSLLIAAVALVFSAYQARLSKRALERTEDALRLSTHVRQLELLDRMHFVISLQVKLDRWIKELSDGLKKVKSAVAAHDPHPLIHLSNTGLTSPANLVERHFYDHAPRWAVELMIQGAAYYYNSVGNYQALWRTNSEEVDFAFAHSLSERLRESIHGIEGLKALISDALPDAVLRSPASISDEAYLER